MTAIAVDAPAPPPHLPLRKVAAVGIGNALAFYDFLTFSFFAIQIGRAFFPAGGDKSVSLLFSLATFGVGFATRPIGGLVIGAYADRAGRKPAMIAAFSLMGIGILGVALTPGWRQIGLAAPILLVFFRLLQGFALGGEVGPSTAFLVEAAPPRRRGLYLALQYATQDFAVLIAGAVGFTLSVAMSPADLDAWGWRAAFLIGAAIVPFGLMMHRSLPETHEPPARKAATAPAHARVRAPLRIVVLGLAMFAASMISNYVMSYITTYAQDSLRLAASAAFGATIALGLASVLADLACGLLADRLGRRPVMLVAVLALMAVTVPGFMLMIAYPTPWVVFAVTAVLAAGVSLMAGPGLMSITESLPKQVRSGALGTIYAVAVAEFGGTTQFAIKALTAWTHSPLAPGWYMTGALAVGAVAIVLMRETAPGRVRTPDALPEDLAPAH